MPQERGNFRRKLFGGFDRTDVINYIENIAGQRNKYQEDAQRLANESAELRSRLDIVTDQLTYRATRIAEISNELDTTRDELNNALKDLRKTRDEIEVIKGLLDRSNKELASIKEQLDKSNNELEIVKGQLEHSNNELAARSAQYEKDMAAAQKALEDAKADAERQRVAAINSATEIVSELRTKYDNARLNTQTATDSLKRELDAVSDNFTEMSTAFTDAEAKFQQLLD